MKNSLLFNLPNFLFGKLQKPFAILSLISLFAIQSFGQSVRWVNNQGATRPASVNVFNSNTNTTTSMTVAATTYTTIQSAIDAAGFNDVVYITNGVYRNTQQQTSTNCSLFGTIQQYEFYLNVQFKTIMITSETGNHCTSDARLVGFGLSLRSSSNTTIQGIHIDSVRVNAIWNSNCCGWGPSNNVKIRNNKITNTRGHGIKTDSGGPTGVKIDRGAWEITGNYFEDIGFFNGNGYCPTPAPVTAMWLAEAGSAFVISNNTINNTKWAGVLCDGFDNVTISGNRINNTRDAGIQLGFTSAANFYIPATANINNNTITNANLNNTADIGAITMRGSNMPGISITNNDISSSFNAVSIQVTGWSSNNVTKTITNNNFYSLSGGYGIKHAAGSVTCCGTPDPLSNLVLTNNYYGAASGPTYPTNPGGTGVGLYKDPTYSTGEGSVF